MPRTSAISRAKDTVLSTFENLPRKAFTESQLRKLLDQYHRVWGLPDYFGLSHFIDFLTRRGRLRRINLHSDKYPKRSLYTWGDASIYQVAAGVHPEAYLSHWTSVFLHGLTEQVPQTVYVNKEQSPKESSSAESLSQGAIDRAFSNAARSSNYIFEFMDRRICLLSGKYTGRLEVGEVKGPGGDIVPATKLERTLIDIAVRPQYAGGVYQVLAAYKTAKGRASSNVLLATLSKLNYVYPYHQVVGFYMWKAGYSETATNLFKSIGMNHDFYLANRIPEKEYVKGWRLYVPKGFESVD